MWTDKQTNRQTDKARKRNSSIELLRVIAMLMIIAHHSAFHGLTNVVLGSHYVNYLNNGSTINHIFALGILPGGEVGNNIFFMITGFFLYKKVSVKVASLTKIELQMRISALLIFIVSMLFYLIGGDIILKNTDYSPVSIGVKYLLIPVLSGEWWFISAYVVLVLMSPAFNSLIINNEKLKPVYVITVGFILFYLSSYVNVQYYGIIRAAFAYILGAYIAKKTSDRSFGFYLSIAIFSWILAVVFSAISVPIISNVLYMAFTVLVSASLLSAFKQLSFSSDTINTLGRATFTVYILHDNFLSRQIFWKNIVNVANVYKTSALYPLIDIVYVLAIFCILAIIDILVVHPFVSWSSKKLVRMG